MGTHNQKTTIRIYYICITNQPTMSVVEPTFQIEDDRFDEEVVARFAKRCRVAARRAASRETSPNTTTSTSAKRSTSYAQEGGEGEGEGSRNRDTQVEGEGHSTSSDCETSGSPVCHEWVHENKQYRMFKRAKFIDNLSRIIARICDRVHSDHNDDVEELRTLTRKFSRPFSASKIYKNLDQFLQQISAEVNFETSCFVNVLVYISRLLQNPNFVLTWFSVHRVVLTCIMVADKTIDDIHSSTSRYAWISGTKKRHLCRMERKFMAMIDYNAFVMPKDFAKAEAYLMNADSFQEPLPQF